MRQQTLPATVVLVLLWCLAPLTGGAETLDVLIRGVYEGPKTSREAAYAAAVMNAKLQAIERAGTEVTAVTEIENFTLKRDWVESRAKALILPGFQLLDMGYQLDGTYQVVFAGRIQVGTERGKLWGKLRGEPRKYPSFREAFAAWKETFPGSIDNQYVNNENGTVMDLKTGLMWHYSYESADSLARAASTVEKLNRDRFAGQNDWRLPTLAEISSLVEPVAAKPLDSGRKSALSPLFDARPYCWYLWSADESPEGPLQAYVGEEKSGIAIAGEHYQADNICVACVKAVRSMQ